MIRICKICGKEFDTKGTVAKCCSDKCKKVNGKENNRNKYLKNKTLSKIKNVSKRKDIARLAEEAKKQGMSYGQYVAMMDMRKQVSAGES